MKAQIQGNFQVTSREEFVKGCIVPEMLYRVLLQDSQLCYLLCGSIQFQVNE